MVRGPGKGEARRASWSPRKGSKVGKSWLQEVQGAAVRTVAAWWRSSLGMAQSSGRLALEGGKVVDSVKKLQSTGLQGEHRGCSADCGRLVALFPGHEPVQWPPGPGGGQSGEKCEKVAEYWAPGRARGCSADCGRLVALFPRLGPRPVAPWPWMWKKQKKFQSPDLQADHRGAAPPVAAWRRSSLGTGPGQRPPVPGSSKNGEKTTKCLMPGLVPGLPPVPCVQRRYRGWSATRENFLSSQSPGRSRAVSLSHAWSARYRGVPATSTRRCPGGAPEPPPTRSTLPGHAGRAAVHGSPK